MSRKQRGRAVVVGITGGIGSGKGLAAEFFREKGAAVVDADEVAHELSQPGEPLVERIVAEFGSSFLQQDGRLARREFAHSIFRDKAAVARLNAITHPVIMTDVEQRIAGIRARGGVPAICLVAPLLLEAGYRRGDLLDRVLIMAAEKNERIRRVMERDGLSAEEVEQRIAAQMSVEEQQPLADWVVDTTAGKQQALARLERIWNELTGA